MNADMTRNVTLPVNAGLSRWSLSKFRFLPRNGGHLSIEFVDYLQNDKEENLCQHLF